MTWRVICLVLAPLFLSQADAQVQHSRADLEFGQLHLGEYLRVRPRNLTGLKDCYGGNDWRHCDFSLGDGIWYGVDEGRLAVKSVSADHRNRPWWIDPNDSPRECKARLERLTRLRFKFAKDDDGNVVVQTTTQVLTANRYWYDIVVRFERGKMKTIYMTSFGDPDN